MQQLQCVDGYWHLSLPRPFLGFRGWSQHSSRPISRVSFASRISCGFCDGDRREEGRGGRRNVGGAKVKKKDNVWSVDNEMASTEDKDEENGKRKSAARRRRRGRRVRVDGRKGRGSRVVVSGAMLMEIETVLQTQEPVIKPAWDTFASSVSGIWKGVGAVFSPFTAEMEPIGVGNEHENLYDCYTLSRIEEVQHKGLGSEIRRKTNWVAFNSLGETKHHAGGANTKDRDGSSASMARFDVGDIHQALPSHDTFDFGKSDMLEEDVMTMEPGLVFFEDGSYSRGPVDIPVGDFDGTKYFLSPTFKFEQCLVKGCHKRLRIVHTIEFNEGGSNIQIVRVAVYEEQWVSPANLDGGSDMQLDLKPASQRPRTQPSDLTGSWKVFEVSATPIFAEESKVEEGGLPFVYLCTETLKKRNLPESSVYFVEEEMLDMQDVTVLWLPGGVTGYVDVNKDGILCIGVGWYSDEGINLVMERDYGVDGKLKEVRTKTEVKRRWTEPFPA